MFALADVVAHRRLRARDVRELRQDAAIQPSGRMALLTRCGAIRIQRLVDEVRHYTQLWLGPGRVVMLRRQRAADRLAHNTPMHTKLRGNTRDRANPRLMLATKLFEQIHFGSPVHARSPDPIGTTLG